VEAEKQYFEPVVPLETVDTDMGDMLQIGDTGTDDGKLRLSTRLIRSIDIREDNVAAALEIMSRFAADPHWLIYLPPTMSPCEISELDDYLEHPLEAFKYYRKAGIRNVVCEKKHMGSRAVMVLCRDVETARMRFGVNDGTAGIIYTRTGRRFFDDAATEKALLDRLRQVLDRTCFWEDFGTDWVCLDTELMPWSEKAQGLIRSQYAPTGRAGIMGLTASLEALKQISGRINVKSEVSANTSGQNVDLTAVLDKYERRLEDMDRYIDAYREYCWTVKSIDDFRIAPFHILATEGAVYGDRMHLWHMETIKRYITAAGDKVFMETPYTCINTESDEDIEKGVAWWTNLTGNGGEGMVVKPETYTAYDEGRLLQPAIKCRGREYLRIIYGPEYLEPEHLKRLKKRSLSRKRTLALKEFALGMESLERYTKGQPLYKVHECAFGVLALESEPVDPRL